MRPQPKSFMIIEPVAAHPDRVLKPNEPRRQLVKRCRAPTNLSKHMACRSIDTVSRINFHDVEAQKVWKEAISWELNWDRAEIDKDPYTPMDPTHPQWKMMC